MFRMDTRPPQGNDGIFATGFAGQQDVIATVKGEQREETRPAGAAAKTAFEDYMRRLESLRPVLTDPAARHSARGVIAVGRLNTVAVTRREQIFDRGDINHRASGVVCLATRLGPGCAWNFMPQANGTSYHCYVCFVPYPTLFKTSSVMGKHGAALHNTPLTSPLLMQWEVATYEVPAAHVLAAFQTECVPIDGNTFPKWNYNEFFRLFNGCHFAWRVAAKPVVPNEKACAALAGVTTRGKSGAAYSWALVAERVRVMTATELTSVAAERSAEEWPGLSTPAAKAELDLAAGDATLAGQNYRRIGPAGGGASVDLAKIQWKLRAIPPVLPLPEPAPATAGATTGDEGSPRGDPFITRAAM